MPRESSGYSRDSAQADAAHIVTPLAARDAGPFREASANLRWIPGLPEMAATGYASVSINEYGAMPAFAAEDIAPLLRAWSVNELLIAGRAGCRHRRREKSVERSWWLFLVFVPRQRADEVNDALADLLRDRPPASGWLVRDIDIPGAGGLPGSRSDVRVRTAPDAQLRRQVVAGLDWRVRSRYVDRCRVSASIGWARGPWLAWVQAAAPTFDQALTGLGVFAGVLDQRISACES